MANISNDEKIMIDLPVEGEEKEEEEEEDEDEEEEGNTYNEANIPAEKEPEAAEIIEQEETSVQEPTFTGYLPPQRDEQAEEIEELRNQNQYLRE